MEDVTIDVATIASVFLNYFMRYFDCLKDTEIVVEDNGDQIIKLLVS